MVEVWQSFVEKIGECYTKYGKPIRMLMGKLTTENSSFNVVTAVYHSPDHDYNADDLIEFLMDSCEQLLSENPNAKKNSSAKRTGTGCISYNRPQECIGRF